MQEEIFITCGKAELLDIMLNAHPINRQIDKLGFIRISNLCSMNDAAKRKEKTNKQSGQKFANHVIKVTSGSSIYKELSNSTVRKQTIYYKQAKEKQIQGVFAANKIEKGDNYIINKKNINNPMYLIGKEHKRSLT